MIRAWPLTILKWTVTTIKWTAEHFEVNDDHCEVVGDHCKVRMFDFPGTIDFESNHKNRDQKIDFATIDSKNCIKFLITTILLLVIIFITIFENY